MIIILIFFLAKYCDSSQMLNDTEALQFSSRTLLFDERGYMTLDEVKSYLVISELIIMTSPDKNRVRQEKLNVLDQLDHFMQGLCVLIYERQQVVILELKTLIFTVEKVSKNSLDKYTHILYNDNTWKVNGRLKLGECASQNFHDTNHLCLGKVALKNYLNKRGVIYMAKLYSANYQFPGTFSCDSALVLPLNEKLAENKEAKCAVWENRWLQSHCKTVNYGNTSIQCVCNNLVYYTLEYTVPEHIQTTTVETQTSKTNIPKINDQTLTTSAATVINLDKPIEEDYHTVCYFIICFSLLSSGILIWAIKYFLDKERLLIRDQTKCYAKLYDEDMLDDIPVKIKTK